MTHTDMHYGGAPATRPATGALVVGVVALVLGLVPFVGLILGVLAIIMGIVALNKKRSRGMSIAGIVMGALATITSIVTSFMLVAMLGWLAPESQNATGSDEPGFVYVPEIGEYDPKKRIHWSELQTGNAPESEHAGTEEDPHLIGTRFMAGSFEVVVNFVDTDATDSLRHLEPENAPPGNNERFVLMNITVNNPGPESASNQDLKVRYETETVGYSVSDRSRNVVATPEPALMLEDRTFTGNYSGYVALRTTDIDGAFVKFTWHDDSDQQWVKVE